MGMAGAFVAVADDYGASSFNPAGLVQLAHREVGAMYSDLYGLGLLSYNSLSWVVPPNAMGAGGITWTHLTGNLEPERWNYDSFCYSYAQFISPRELARRNTMTSWGVNLKYLKQSSPWGDGSGYSVDLAYFMRRENLSWGVNIRDVVSVTRWSTGTRETTPLSIKVGGAYRFEPDILAALDLDLSGTDLLSAVHAGGEWRATPSLAVRGGVSTLFQEDPFLTISAGVGFDFPLEDLVGKGGASFDYAFSYNETLGNTHQFALSLAF